MRKILFGLVSVLVLSAIVVAPAFGTQWLVNKLAVEEELPAETAGLLTLIKYGSGGVALIKFHCEGLFDGFIGGAGESKALGWITDVLDTTGTITVGNLEDEGTQTPLSCEVTFDEGALTDCKAGTLASVWVDGLSLTLEDKWHIELELITSTTFGLVILKLNNLEEPAGYEVECESLLGVKGSELCNNAEPLALVSNNTGVVPAAVFGLFEPTPEGECTMTGANSAGLEGEGNTWALNAAGERLETAVSE